MPIPVVVIGAGGFGRESLDVIAAMNGVHHGVDVVGVVDAAPSALNLTRLADRGVRYLGTEEEWLCADREADFVVGVGNPGARADIAERWIGSGRSPMTLVHPLANIGSLSTVGAGSVICAGVQISTNVRLDEYVHLNANVTIGHDSVLERYVSINPGAIVSGEVLVATGSLVGAGAVILQGLKVGKSSVIGAAACVVRDVDELAVVKGIPAR